MMDYERGPRWIFRVELPSGTSFGIESFDCGSARNPPIPELAAIVEEIRAALKVPDPGSQAAGRTDEGKESTPGLLICRYLSGVQCRPDRSASWHDRHPPVRIRRPGAGNSSPGWLPRWLPVAGSLSALGRHGRRAMGTRSAPIYPGAEFISSAGHP